MNHSFYTAPYSTVSPGSSLIQDQEKGNQADSTEDKLTTTMRAFRAMEKDAHETL